MKKFLSSALGVILFSSAFNISAQNNVSLEIVHALNTSEFAMNTQAETPEGVKFDLNRLEYYISEISLTHDGGVVTDIQNLWALVNANDNTVIDLGSLDVTEIENIKFSIGVDPEHNHLDPSTYGPSHPLAHKNPSMHWGWTAGYRFVAIEGNGGEQLNQLFEIHALGDGNYFDINIAVSATAENGALNAVIYGDYCKALAGIDVSTGIISHGEVGESIDLLENFRDFVYSTSSPIDTTDTASNEEPNGISEVASGLEFQLYPNPAVNGSTIVSSSSLSPQSIVVFDLTGKQLITETLNAGKQLNINNLESGVYFVRVNDLVSNEVLVKKLSVQ